MVNSEEILDREALLRCYLSVDVFNDLVCYRPSNGIDGSARVQTGPEQAKALCSMYQMFFKQRPQSKLSRPHLYHRQRDFRAQFEAVYQTDYPDCVNQNELLPPVNEPDLAKKEQVLVKCDFFYDFVKAINRATARGFQFELLPKETITKECANSNSPAAQSLSSSSLSPPAIATGKPGLLLKINNPRVKKRTSSQDQLVSSSSTGLDTPPSSTNAKRARGRAGFESSSPIDAVKVKIPRSARKPSALPMMNNDNNEKNEKNQGETAGRWAEYKEKLVEMKLESMRQEMDHQKQMQQIERDKLQLEREKFEYEKQKHLSGQDPKGEMVKALREMALNGQMSGLACQALTAYVNHYK